MSTSFTQANRFLSVTTPLGTDELLLSSFTGKEEMSRLFWFELEMFSTNDSIDASQLVGQSITFSTKLDDGSERYYNGYVSRFVAGGEFRRGLRRYRAEVVPWLWFLTRSADCKIYQSQTAVQIIESIFSDFGFTDYDTGGITGSYPTYDYSVQYRETAFNYISRLMEQESIFYYFSHDNGTHTLMLGDDKTAYKDCVENSVPFVTDRSRRERTDGLTEWEHQYAFRSGKFTQTDYNFIDHPARTTKTPSSLMQTQEETVVSLTDIKNYEIYDYPGLYSTSSDGSQYTKSRMESEEVPYEVTQGTATCRTFTPGGKFTVNKHPLSSEENKSYVITSIDHFAIEPSEYTGGDGVEYEYFNKITCIPDSTKYRPSRITPKPTVKGTQTAVVVGPSGEEIWPDQYGRVKVQFFWDRVGVRDENSSCWVRCAQQSAGKNWGAMYIPRIGQEVVITYLEGDPDRPLITGMVYNADQMPAYTLPDEKTKSYVKTNSTKGGEGYNEIRFEDLADSEQIFVHAQRNMDLRVLNDRMRTIENNDHLTVGGGDDGTNGTGSHFSLMNENEHYTTKGDRQVKVEGNTNVTYGKGDNSDGGNYDLYIAQHRNETIEGDNNLHIKGIQNVKVEGDVQRLEQGNEDNYVGGNRNHYVGGNENNKVAGNQVNEVSSAASMKCDSFDLDASSSVAIGTGTIYLTGTDVVLEGSTSLTIKCGGSFIALSSASVAITGSSVLINSGGSAGSGSGPSASSATEAAQASPTDAVEASPTLPTAADNSKTGIKSAPDSLS